MPTPDRSRTVVPSLSQLPLPPGVRAPGPVVSARPYSHRHGDTSQPAAPPRGRPDRQRARPRTPRRQADRRDGRGPVARASPLARRRAFGPGRLDRAPRRMPARRAPPGGHRGGRRPRRAPGLGVDARRHLLPRRPRRRGGPHRVLGGVRGPGRDLAGPGPSHRQRRHGTGRRRAGRRRAVTPTSWSPNWPTRSSPPAPPSRNRVSPSSPPAVPPTSPPPSAGRAPRTTRATRPASARYSAPGRTASAYGSWRSPSTSWCSP